MRSLFLAGYGLSLSVKNTRLVFKQGINDPFSERKPEVLELPASACNFDKVIIQGRGYISTEARVSLADRESIVNSDSALGSLVSILTSPSTRTSGFSLSSIACFMKNDGVWPRILHFSNREVCSSSVNFVETTLFTIDLPGSTQSYMVYDRGLPFQSTSAAHVFVLKTAVYHFYRAAIK